MDLSATPLEQLGASAHGHYKAGEKAQDRAEQQMLAAGLYLKEAKERLDLRKNPNAPMNFAQFLLHHCPIGKSRAYEIIAIADGRKTLDEDRQRHTERHAREREEREAGRADVSERSETTERTQDDTGHSQTPDRGGKQHPDRHIRETDGSAAQRGAEGSYPIDSGTRTCPSSQGHFVSGTCGHLRGNQEDHSLQTNRRTQPKPTSPQGRATTFIDEAQAAHDALVKEICALVRKQDTTTLLNIKELLQ